MQQLLSITWANQNNEISSRQQNYTNPTLKWKYPKMKCKNKFWETTLSMLVKIKYFEVYRKEKVDQKKS